MGWESRLPALTEKCTDESTEREFRFTFYCECCGTGFQTPALPFSGADGVGGFHTFTTAQTLIWQAEHEDAYERANQQAMFYFQPCMGCGKKICEDCTDELADEALCPDCRRARREEVGEPIRQAKPDATERMKEELL